MDRTVDVTCVDQVGVIELNRPDKANSLGRSAFGEIEAAMSDFECRDDVRAVLVRARGRHFSTGGDLAEAKAMRDDAAELREFLERVHRTLGRLEESPLPVVAACQGLVLAGGLELALACDVVFAAADARFGDQHVQYGLVPAWGGTQRLPRAVGRRRALDMMFSGRWIDADTACRWGIATHVVAPDDLHTEALRYCATLASRSRPGLAAMKQLSRHALGNSDEGLRRERAHVVRAMSGTDPAEGIAAFEERRTPRFTA